MVKTEIEHLEEKILLRFEAHKLALELQAKIDQERNANITKKVDWLIKVVSIGIGVILALQFVILYLGRMGRG